MRDKIIEKLIKEETRRQKDVINLVASENYVSSDVMRASGSALTNKYSEGYPGRRFYAGNEVIDQIEIVCRERALKLFGLNAKQWSVNVQAHSGSPANLAIFAALVPLGGKIMGLRLDMGGHLTHAQSVSFTGKVWRQVSYVLDKNELLDYDAILRLAKKNKPQLIVAGYTAYPRRIDFKKFRAIADAVGAYFMVDMSHLAGLIAGGAYPSPFPYADVVMGTTHKTLRGPRGALIFARSDVKCQRSSVSIAKAIDRSVFPGLQGGPHDQQTAAIAVALQEASRPDFKKYARQVVKNAKVLAAELSKRGWRLISGGTESHLLIIDVWQRGLGGVEAATRLEKCGIIANKNSIPNDLRSPFDPSGLRFGTAALTTRGMKEKEMRRIATLIDEGLSGGKNKEVLRVVRALTKKFPIK
ncbi:MAG: serine hydroxymethyltransferase [Candidatus Niyogibacteria bacterium]|nr:serine hydroxymethyltransferase [Candidatus Niyogibacteria bacterium]